MGTNKLSAGRRPVYRLRVVVLARLELATWNLVGTRSVRLSYSTVADASFLVERGVCVYSLVVFGSTRGSILHSVKFC